MYNPVSTYRFQFNDQFPLRAAEQLLPYLQALGVKTIYGSPIYVSTPYSSHGYDGVDPTRLNPQITTDDQLRAFSQRLRQAGMGWVQDIVPNHLAYHPNNEWLMDLLEKGPLARHAHFFDNSLASPFFHGRIMAPFLPADLDKTLAERSLELAYEGERFVFKVQGNVLPLKPTSYATVLRAGAAEPSDAIGQLLNQLDQLRHDDQPDTCAIAWDEFRQQLTALMKSDVVHQYVADCLKTVQNDTEQLKQLTEEQHYRFCTEVDTRREMTYRRFFTVNGLICLNMADQTVFDAYHGLTKSLVDEGVFQGVRVDHVDGLYDPTGYLERLRALLGDGAYIVIEKILQADEALPQHWPIQGTSGYEFLALVNNLLTYQPNEDKFRQFYHNLIGNVLPLHRRVEDRKAFFLANYMGGELANLTQHFLNLNLADADAVAHLNPAELSLTIGELLVRCPVYRYYANALPLPQHEADALRTMLDAIRQTRPDLKRTASLIEDVLLMRPQTGDAEFNSRAIQFYQRLMQFTSPLMAKGVEDTLLYTYNAFIGHNEVGDSPERFGLSVSDFHRAMQDRQTHWPLAQNGTSTHDTKRGEDVRARLNVLTELADEWLNEVRRWQTLNDAGKQHENPDPNDEYFIYQNLIGAYPMPGEDDTEFAERFHQYMEKAMAEAKRHTHHHYIVDEPYRSDTQAFVDKLLDKQRPFWTRFEPFHKRVADFGVTNSLVQTLLKCTCPGLPDIYRGADGWELSLVDPDNRRPVNFIRRADELNALIERQRAGDKTLWADLWANRFDGRIKLWLTRTLLYERNQNANLFAYGDYVPLTVEGAHAEHVLAFARRHAGQYAVVTAPLHAARLCTDAQTDDLLTLDWRDTRVVLPTDAPTHWTNRLDGTSVDGANGIRVGDVLRPVPVAVLV